jgi:hypothetical protein
MLGWESRLPCSCSVVFVWRVMLVECRQVVASNGRGWQAVGVSPACSSSFRQWCVIGCYCDLATRVQC